MSVYKISKCHLILQQQQAESGANIWTLTLGCHVVKVGNIPEDQILYPTEQDQNVYRCDLVI